MIILFILYLWLCEDDIIDSVITNTISGEMESIRIVIIVINTNILINLIFMRYYQSFWSYFNSFFRTKYIIVLLIDNISR